MSGPRPSPRRAAWPPNSPGRLPAPRRRGRRWRPSRSVARPSRAHSRAGHGRPGQPPRSPDHVLFGLIRGASLAPPARARRHTRRYRSPKAEKEPEHRRAAVLLPPDTRRRGTGPRSEMPTLSPTPSRPAETEGERDADEQRCGRRTRLPKRESERGSGDAHRNGDAGRAESRQPNRGHDAEGRTSHRRTRRRSAGGADAA